MAHLQLPGGVGLTSLECPCVLVVATVDRPGDDVGVEGDCVPGRVGRRPRVRRLRAGESGGCGLPGCIGRRASDRGMAGNLCSLPSRSLRPGAARQDAGQGHNCGGDTKLLATTPQRMNVRSPLSDSQTVPVYPLRPTCGVPVDGTVIRPGKALHRAPRRRPRIPIRRGLCAMRINASEPPIGLAPYRWLALLDCFDSDYSWPRASPGRTSATSTARLLAARRRT